ncbi:MAG: hypothetical protein WBA87_15170 [Microbacterium sp.]
MDVGYVVRQLRAAGLDAEITDAGLLLAGKPTHLEEMETRPATPSDLKRILELCRARGGIDGTRPVISSRRASPQAIAWVRDHPEVTLILGDRVIFDGVEHRPDSSPATPPRRKGPQPFARFATARALLSGASRNDQVRLAELAGVTQGSVSNALRRLPETEEPGATFDGLLRDYPGPGGQSYYWWSGSPVNEQAQHLADRGALLSGDFAADRIAPWRMPERVIAYLDSPIDLSPAGYVLAHSSDYTTLVVVAADPTLRTTARAWGTGDIADPIITAYDVLRTATTGDEDEAVDMLRDVVIKQFTGTRHHG